MSASLHTIVKNELGFSNGDIQKFVYYEATSQKVVWPSVTAVSVNWPYYKKNFLMLFSFSMANVMFYNVILICIVHNCVTSNALTKANLSLYNFLGNF